MGSRAGSGLGEGVVRVLADPVCEEVDGGGGGGSGVTFVAAVVLVEALDVAAPITNTGGRGGVAGSGVIAAGGVVIAGATAPPMSEAFSPVASLCMLNLLSPLGGRRLGDRSPALVLRDIASRYSRTYGEPNPVVAFCGRSLVFNDGESRMRKRLGTESDVFDSS